MAAQGERPKLATTARAAAIATVVLCVASSAIAFVIDQRIRAAGRDDLSDLTGADLVYVLGLVASAGVAVVLLIRRPSHPVGWLFAGLAIIVGLSGATTTYAEYGLFVRPGGIPGDEGVAVLANALFIWLLVLVALVCSLTPDGHYLSNRWRIASHVMVAAGALWFVLKLISPGPLEEPFESLENPWALTSVDLSGVRLMAATLNNALVLAGVLSLGVRFIRSKGESRRQLLWIAVMAVPLSVLLVVAFVGAVTGNEPLTDLAFIGFVVLLPIGAGLAVSRYHLYDVDRILSRAVIYVIVSALVAGTYVAVVVLLARVVGQAVDRSPTAITLATLAAAAAARPIYTAVRDAIDHRFQRRRYEAVRQVREFVANPSRQRDLEGVLREALDDPSLRVAYWDEDLGSWVTEDGHPVDVDPAAFTVERRGRTVAAVSTTCDDEALVRAVIDEGAPELDNAALRAAIAAQLEEVRASRERIAEAQIEERRRIERDLHDGAQQRLLGTAAQMQAALLNGSPDRLRAALELGVDEARQTVVELRALANGLHPTVLQDGGLSAALDELATRLPVSVVVSEPDRRYSPVVEAAAWFAACEAISNAVKHAAPTHIVVRLDDQGDELHLVVDDDGCGGADLTGAGLRGLADRVEAAGGRLLVRSDAAAGTQVEAVLPCGS